MELFRFQADHNPIYRQYLHFLGYSTDTASRLSDVPFLPIRFFKDHSLKTWDFEPEAIFESSGTTGQITSKHWVASMPHYHEVCRTGFQRSFGSPTDFHIFSLLPGYLDRKNASLVAMMAHLHQISNSEIGGFFLHDLEGLIRRIEQARKERRKVLLVGVTFALLDLLEMGTQDWPDVLVLETGGMKGRRKEIVRAELHQTLREGLGVKEIYSEYGMTELMSQAYTTGTEAFCLPPWMGMFLRDTNDPFGQVSGGRAGGINVIDLANYHSCAFIETMDIGKRSKEGFEVLGRFDHADVRGCNLMVQ